MADLGGVIRFANPAVRSVFGWNSEELAGHTLDVLQPADLSPGEWLQTFRAAGRANLLREAKQTALDEKQKPAERAAAVRTLGLETFAEVRALFPQLLQLRQPQPVQTAALETLARFDDGAVPALLAAMNQRDVELRRRAFLVLQHIGGAGVDFDPFAPETQRRQQISALYARFNIRPF